MPEQQNIEVTIFFSRCVSAKSPITEFGRNVAGKISCIVVVIRAM